MANDEQLRQWRSFVCIAELGGFSRAAEALSINQPNLSRNIATLEGRLGLRLFDRKARGVALTGPGAELLEPARDLLGRLEQLRLHARRIAVGEAGVLRLGASTQALVSFVAPFVGSFLRNHPGVDVRLAEGHVDELIEGIGAGRLDFGVVGAMGAPPLQALALYSADIEYVVPAAQVSDRGRSVDVVALDRQPVMLPSRASLTRRRFDAACAESGVQPEIRLESESVEALLALVEEGYGCAVLPATVAHRSRQVRRLPIRSKGRKVSATMYLVWNGALYQSRAAALLRDEIHAFARTRTRGATSGRSEPD
jgi:LysR family transcriptional regulator, nitrogen assimilation regulatory protein